MNLRIRPLAAVRTIRYLLGDGLGDGDCDGDGVGSCAPLARALLVVVMLGVAMAVGATLAK